MFAHLLLSFIYHIPMQRNILSHTQTHAHETSAPSMEGANSEKDQIKCINTQNGIDSHAAFGLC